MLDAVNVSHGAVALGIGMLVGLERERKKGRNEDHAAAGLRTFAITALLGYVSMLLAGPVLVGVASLSLVLMLCMHYRKHADKDPEVTSEIALLLVLTLGALSLDEPELATAVGVVLTVLLALRRELHHFVLQQLSEEELRDGLMLLTVALVVLPLTPDRFMGPYGALNPRTICTLVVLLMTAGALGHIAMRLVGPRYGLPLSAIASGFASGTATIALLAHEARRQVTAVRPLAAAAVLSNLASIAQFALVLGIVDRHLLKPFVASIGLGTVGTVVYGTLLLAPWRSDQGTSTAHQGDGAFDLFTALIITVALTGNTLTKCILSLGSGGCSFGRYLVPGQLVILGAMWLGLLI